MTKRDYADILKFAINGQITYMMEELKKTRSYEEEKYIDGVIMGLRIALEKIDASAFLWDNRERKE